MQYTINKIPAQIDVVVDLPASKSISNRLLMISALSGNKVNIENLSESDDTQTMKQLLHSGEKIKNAGHAGTTMRFLTAYYSQGNDEVILTGSERMKDRPIAELVNGLKNLGAEIDYLEKSGFPPLKIKGKKLHGGKISMHSGISSQYISAILMIAPFLEGGLELNLTGEMLSTSYIDMTIALMKQAGAVVDRKNNLIMVGSKSYNSCDLKVEPDWSSASYWFMIAGLHSNARILLHDLKEESLQGDSHISNMFGKLGVNCKFSSDGLYLSYSSQQPREFRYDFTNNPDMVQSFVPYCVARDIPFYFSGCKTLRIKETDRVSALYHELKKFGVEISYSEDGDTIWWDGLTRPDWLRKITISTYKDHRMALGMVPLCIKSGELSIDDPMVVTKSYPGFWDDFGNAGFTFMEG